MYSNTKIYEICHPILLFGTLLLLGTQNYAANPRITFTGMRTFVHICLKSFLRPILIHSFLCCRKHYYLQYISNPYFLIFPTVKTCLNIILYNQQDELCEFEFSPVHLKYLATYTLSGYLRNFLRCLYLKFKKKCNIHFFPQQHKH